MMDLTKLTGGVSGAGAAQGKLAGLANTPQGKLVGYALDAIDGVLSFKTGLDFPNGEQTLAFADQLIVNWGYVAAVYADDWSNSHAWARQDTAGAFWNMATNAGWPCSGKIALCAKVVQLAFPGKKAGSACVADWTGKLGLLLDGKPAPYYEQFANGKGIGPVKMCQPGGIAITLIKASSPLGIAIASGSSTVWELYQGSLDYQAALEGQDLKMEPAQVASVAKTVALGGKINILAGALLIKGKQLQQLIEMVDAQGSALINDYSVKAADSDTQAFADAIGKIGKYERAAAEQKDQPSMSPQAMLAAAVAIAILARG